MYDDEEGEIIFSIVLSIIFVGIVGVLPHLGDKNPKSEYVNRVLMLVNLYCKFFNNSWYNFFTI